MLAIIIAQNTTRCLLIIQQKSEQESVTVLPLLETLDFEKARVVSKKHLSDELVLLYIDREYSPWDLFSPFPPKGYYDYGYIDLQDLSGSFTLRDGDSVEEYNYQDILEDKSRKAILLARKVI